MPTDIPSDVATIKVDHRRGLSYFRPLRIDRYILGEVLGPFLGGIVFFLFIFLMFQVLRLADFFIIHGVSILVLSKLTALLTMSFLPIALPVAFLIAVLIAFGRLSSDSELVAMKANGFSIARLSIPIALLSIIVFIVTAALSLAWVPWSLRTYKTNLIKVSNTKVVSAIQQGTFTAGFFDLLIFADKVDNRTNRLERVFIYDEREAGNPLAVVANTGEIVPVKTDTELGAAALLKLYNGSIHRNDQAENLYQKINFGEYNLFLKVDEGAEGSVLKPEMLSYNDLTGKIAATSVATFEGREWRGEYWRRVSIAIAPILFVFLGIGFGTVRTRSVRAGAGLVALVTFAGYYSLQIVSTILIQKGVPVPPAILMEISNFAVLCAAIFSFRKASW
jgi:lipopolysaccharide export system permease protein